MKKIFLSILAAVLLQGCGPTASIVSTGITIAQSGSTTKAFAASGSGLFIKEKKHIPIFILGPKEKRLYSILKKKHFPGLKIVETSNPLKTINISKDCKFGIANDTGCGHLIANSGIPLISLFGPTNHHKFAPIGNSKNTVISSQDLYKNNNINMIKTADVIETIKTIID